MKSIYEFSDYRLALRYWIKNSSTKGYQSKLAEAAEISTSLFSLILKGNKNMSLEQAAGLCEYFGFDTDQTHYFFLLVELGRAGSQRLKQLLVDRLYEMRSNLAKRVGQADEVSDKIKATYYSNWTYTGIRNLIAVSGYQTPEDLAKKLNIPIKVVVKVINFLKANGFIVEEKGKFIVGQRKIHIDKSSVFVTKHHENWRLKGISEMANDSRLNVFFTSPMSLSKEAAEKIRSQIPKMIQEIMDISGPSESEEVYCLNIDWFHY